MDMGNYKNGKLEGLTESFWDEGQPSGTLLWKNGELDKLWYFYGSDFDRDSRSTPYKFKDKGNYIDGKVEGLWERFYDTGHLMSRCYHKNGIPHLVEVFHPNGKLIYKGNYKKGKKHGLVELFYRKRSVVEERKLQK